VISWQSGQSGYTHLWADCLIQPARLTAATKVAGILDDAQHKPRYQAVAQATGVAWWVIAAIHCRESGADFKTQLWQGDPLNARSVHDPKGKGPYSSWEQCAIEAIKANNPGEEQVQTPPKACWFAENYNGWGYQQHGTNSPYVWAATNWQQPGKYTSDHHWDAAAQDTQLGCAAIWKAMIANGQTLDTTTENKEAKPMATTTQPAPADVQLDQAIATIKHVGSIASMFTGFLPKPWNQVAATIEPLAEDVARWIDAARNQQTSSADVQALIGLTIQHVGALANAFLIKTAP